MLITLIRKGVVTAQSQLDCFSYLKETIAFCVVSNYFFFKFCFPCLFSLKLHKYDY